MRANPRQGQATFLQAEDSAGVEPSRLRRSGFFAIHQRKARTHKGGVLGPKLQEGSTGTEKVLIAIEFVGMGFFFRGLLEEWW